MVVVFIRKRCFNKVHENQHDPESLIPSANPDQQVQLKNIKQVPDQVPDQVSEKVPEKVSEKEAEAKQHLVT